MKIKSGMTCDCCQTDGYQDQGWLEVSPPEKSGEHTSLTLCELCQEAFIDESATPRFESDVINRDQYELLAQWVKDQQQPEAEPNNAGQSQPTDDYYDGGSAQDGKEFKEFFISQPPNCIAVFPERLGSSKAHRDFVLRAVNSHAALLAACEAALKERTELVSPEPYAQAKLTTLLREVIAKAKAL